MSLSRVIKSGTVDDRSVREFRFGTLEGQNIAGEGAENPGFIAFSGIPAFSPGDGHGAVAQPETLVEDYDAAQEADRIRITEAELQDRLVESYGRGYEEGQQQAEKGLANAFKALRRAIDEVRALREEIFRQSEEDILKLAILVARKIIQQEIIADRRILARIVAAALENASERDEVVVRLNPEDYHLVNSHRQQYLQGVGDERNLNLKPDDTISLGGCVVDTLTGEIDARLESQLDEIHKRLLEDRGVQQDEEEYAYEEA